MSKQKFSYPLLFERYELKCTTQVPRWFMDLIVTFNLTRTSFSKYVTGVSEVIYDNQPHMNITNRGNTLFDMIYA